MKLFIIMLLLLSQAFAYKGVIYRDHKGFSTNHSRVYYHGHGRYYYYNEPYTSSAQVVSQSKEPTHDEKVKEANRQAREQNKKIGVEADKSVSPNQTDTVEHKKIDYSKYEKSPQLIVGNVHLYGVSEVKRFKDNKLLVKAANGNFAFPKKVYESAQKLNFDTVNIIHIEK